ncbi:MAG TPA: glycoside hydrolase family 3 N-terminal domain-containing protein [Actinomycetes bacterium]
MSELDQMAHRVVMGSFAGPSLPRWAEDRLASGLGSVAFFGSNVESPDQLAALSAALRAANPDVLVATDEEGGDVTRLHMDEGSPQPGNAALGAADDEDLTAAVAAEIGHELASVGVDLDLAPVVDVNSNPANPVIGVRSFGADPALVARHTRAWVAGLQSAGVAACAKHFPGHGDTSVDSHLGLPRVDAPLDVLRARELVPFVAAVESGALAVMTSHVLLPALDPGAPATLSGIVLGLLRSELGFDGLLVSDALDMAGASAGRGEAAAAVLALMAGCDLLCLGADKDAADVDRVVDAIVGAVKAGSLAEDRLAEAAGRVLAVSRRVQGWRGGGAFPTDDATAGRDAATRAVRVEGSLPALTGATVLRFRTGQSMAVGEVPWGLPVDAAVLRGRRHLDVTESTDLTALLRDAGHVGDAAVVAMVREPHRHPWVAARLAELAAICPELVTVEMGWPGPAQLPGRATVLTYGASKVNGEALDAVLAGATH